MNPELRRHAWLELGTHRLLLTPLVLGALAAIPLAASNTPASTLAWGAFWLFLILTVGWGSLRALASVTDEVRERTWDFQRMAALTPAQLALGKVFGAPLFQWYVGAWCLAALAIAGAAAGVRSLASLLVGAIAAAVLLHALGVAVSTAGARARLGERTRRAAGLLVLVAVVQAVPLGAMLHPGDGGQFVRWWGWRMPAETFGAASLVLMAGWGLVAAWRAMLRELQEPARPWAWPAFAAFAAFWWAGLSTPTQARPGLSEVLALAAAVMTLATYVACTMDPLTRVGLARMQRAWQPAARRRQAGIPVWVMHGALATLAGAFAFPAAAVAYPGTADPLVALALPVALMAVRDAAVISCFALSASARPPVGRGVFYIALLDLLVPALAYALQWPGLARAAFPLLAAPDRPAQAAWGMGVHAALALVALALCVARARQAERARAAG